MGRSVVLFLWIAIAVAVGDGSAQVSPPPTTPAAPPPSNAASQGYIEAHNRARAEVGVGPLKWSDTLAKSASLTARYQRDRLGCAFANLTNSKFGGNQLWASRSAVTPGEAVGTWEAEKAFYDYANNTCTPDHRCGVYTQVVWKNSLELGCAQVQCAKQQASLTICFYNPPGNVVGEKPY